MDPMTYLPREINVGIQNYFDKGAAYNYCLVSKTYNELITNNNEVWQRIFPGIIFPKEIRTKTYLDAYIIACVGSNETVIERIEQLARTLEFGQVAEITLLLPYSIGFTLKVDIESYSQYHKYILQHASQEVKVNSEVAGLKETYIFMKKLQGFHKVGDDIRSLHADSFAINWLLLSYFSKV